MQLAMAQFGARDILWDHGGVFVDTEHWCFEATAEAVGRLGIHLDRARHLQPGR